MEHNIILAGVGGQGILTIAHTISTAAMRRGWKVKQAEVHGMSQRGGAVYSHLRLADHEIHSDLISLGECDLILAMEPLESLRYAPYLRENGCIISNTTPLVNITNYPPIEGILDRISERVEHVLLDADRLAKAAGSGLAGNSVLLGAAAHLFDGVGGELEQALCEHFAAKGPRVVEANRRAFRLGLAASAAYRDAMKRGVLPRAVREWATTVSANELMDTERPDVARLAGELTSDSLTEAEAKATAQVLEKVHAEGRSQLYEHEVYHLVELVGAISPPQHHFLSVGESVTPELLQTFPGEKVVLKVVSRDIVHKSEAGAVVFVRKEPETVRREIDRLISRQSLSGAHVDGVLLVEFVERNDSGFGQELFIGIRASREFGAIIAAGLGGVDTEYLAHKMKPGVAVAKALVSESSPEQFFELFRRTAAYDILSGGTRGHQRVVSDGELMRCFRAFLGLAQRFCVFRGGEGPSITELEVNPFAFRRQRMVPLDGRGRIGEVTRPTPPRPTDKIAAMLEPRSIAVVGVSGKRENFGRIILDNIRDCGFPIEHLYVLKAGVEEMDNVRCVSRIDQFPEPIDLMVVATSQGLPELMDQIVDCGKVPTVILIPGGLGETRNSEQLQEQLRKIITTSRSRADRGPIVLGGNCLGMRSRPGRFDTFFVPNEKLSPRRGEPTSRTALITQSGAFAITRVSNLESVNPAFAITIGNQIDLTVSDLVQAVGRREDIDAIGVYVEGFKDLDGLAFVRAVEDAVAAGKTVVFYKAGRTAPGRTATAGHTASIAGDHEMCQAALASAGAIVTDTFKEFEQVLEIATRFHDRSVGGRRIGVISNAGFEAVGMADAILGARYELEMPNLSAEATMRIAAALDEAKLGSLVNIRNPLDLNPMANEDVYEACIRVMLEDGGLDAVVISVVPFTPKLCTTPQELVAESVGSLAQRLPALMREFDKPMIVVIDAGRPYDILASAIRRGGVPVFPSCDQAIRSLGRYLCHRTERGNRPQISTRTARPTVDRPTLAVHHATA